MSIVLIKKVEQLERDVADLKARLNAIESQAKPTEQPAEPPDLRTREGKAWKNANSLR